MTEQPKEALRYEPYIDRNRDIVNMIATHEGRWVEYVALATQREELERVTGEKESLEGLVEVKDDIIAKHERLNFDLRSEVTRLSQPKECPAIGVEVKCLVCGLVKPWGLFHAPTGATVCVACRDAQAALTRKESELAAVIKGARVSIPTATMEQEFQTYFVRGQKSRDEEVEALKAELAAVRDAARAFLAHLDRGDYANGYRLMFFKKDAETRKTLAQLDALLK